jgi:hypothetical protein
MRLTVATAVLAGLLGTSGSAQDAQPTRPVAPAQDGGVREVMESIVVPPIPNAPFTASLSTEWARPTPDGGTITLGNQREIARDNQGRVYEQRWSLVPKNGSAKSILTWIQVADPNQHTLYNCNAIKMVCDLLVYDAGPDLAAAARPAVASGPLRNGRGNLEVENLGTKIVDGVDTVGTRQTTTIAPGTIGNDKTVTKVTETWRAELLALNLISIRSDPMSGTQRFTVTELDANAPDPQLFEVPEGFKVVDQRTTREPSQ